VSVPPHEAASSLSAPDHPVLEVFDRLLIRPPTRLLLESALRVRTTVHAVRPSVCAACKSFSSATPMDFGGGASPADLRGRSSTRNRDQYFVRVGTYIVPIVKQRPMQAYYERVVHTCTSCPKFVACPPASIDADRQRGRTWNHPDQDPGQHRHRSITHARSEHVISNSKTCMSTGVRA
jgi:hypothetical protein